MKWFLIKKVKDLTLYSPNSPEKIGTDFTIEAEVRMLCAKHKSSNYCANLSAFFMME